jgi:tRNA(Ile)-lysidine synthetase-like protein
VTSGSTKGIKAVREDGVVRPLLPLWREETEAFCRERGLAFRTDSSNADTTRGLIRDEILPLLERIHPAARENILRSLEERRTMPPALAKLLDTPVGSRRLDLGGGVQAVREHDRLWLEQGPVRLDGQVDWGGWRISSELPGLVVRGWRAGDRLAGRSKKIQDVFVDAKIPRSDREAWPLVCRGDEVVAVPGIVEVDGVEAIQT